jgi:MFS family permease
VLKTDNSDPAAPSPFSVNNVRMFIAFRVFFNCRFYYPIFTVLFLDFGLTVAQFSILNAVWAATIVLAEVPSGALADIVGRRRLLVFAAVSMLVEMAILCLAPRGNIPLLFSFFLINRVLSGLAEAAASGADEAIAYDALQAEGMADQWGRVLDVQMRLRSVMFILTMTIGAAVYDPDLMTRMMAAFGSDLVFVQSQTLRFPLYLTFILALFTLAAVLRLDEICPNPEADGTCEQPFGGSAMDAFKLTLSTGGWIFKTPFVLAVILFGMLFDGILRMVITLASQYYRMVQLPESVFGILGSVMAVAGLFIPRLALRIAENRSPAFCLWSTAATALAGLIRHGLLLALRGPVRPGADCLLLPIHGGFLRELFCKPSRRRRRAGPRYSASRAWLIIFPTDSSAWSMQACWRSKKQAVSMLAIHGQPRR